MNCECRDGYCPEHPAELRCTNEATGTLSEVSGHELQELCTACGVNAAEVLEAVTFELF